MNKAATIEKYARGIEWPRSCPPLSPPSHLCILTRLTRVAVEFCLFRVSFKIEMKILLTMKAAFVPQAPEARS